MSERLDQSIVHDGARVVYDVYGSGSNVALVFIHGWSCSGALWYQQAPLFHKYPSLVIDLPGHGRSDAPKVEYSLEKMGVAVNEVMAKEGVTKSVLMGHSMGGPVSTMTLRLNPSGVVGVVYVDSFFHLPESYLTASQRKDLAVSHADDKKFREFLDPFKTDKTSSENWKRVVDTMTGTPLHVRTNATTTLVQPHAWKYDEIYDIPALHLVTPYFANIDRHWEHHLPQLKQSIWHGNGHFLFMEEPERFNKAVEEFVTKHGLL
ncbi:hypothetical protein B0A52_04518 [Exophiala mesophila]|uniref:AB hydrolase-1 domain-containing protein n=1 Tax=Exophiala mesophila TaxID=212818 RepID=A0A438N957_EXOME|nr:hypothetical protein B0A52_04518 [Exophiala mesophila]